MMKSIGAPSPGRWTFFDHASPRSTAGKKLAPKRSAHFPGGHFAAGAWCPKNLQCVLCEAALKLFENRWNKEERKEAYGH
jgi:hypothetical protein